MLAHRRNFSTALALSVIVHALIFSIPRREKPPGEEATLAFPSLEVRIVEPSLPAREESKPTPSEATPSERPKAVLQPPRLAPREVRMPAPPAPATAPAPPERSPETRFDMAALIESRRAQRRALEHAAAQGQPEPSAEELAQANINRNLRMAPHEGVGGVFQILHMGVRTAEFAFNGWRPDTDRQWREVIEVDAAPGVDLEHAIVRRMIQLIRSHYEGDFRWESRRVGRVVVLSARPEDNDGLEDFLIREFFGTPTLK